MREMKTHIEVVGSSFMLIFIFHSDRPTWSGQGVWEHTLTLRETEYSTCICIKGTSLVQTCVQ